MRSVLFRVIAVVTAVVACVAGCSTPQPDSAPIVVTANGTEPQKPLIPAETFDVGGLKIINLLFSGLVYYSEDGTVDNEVARSIDTADNTTYTIKLNPDWVFSDGTPVTANSFVKAWRAAARDTSTVTSTYAPIVGTDDTGNGDLSGVTATNNTTLTITLKSPDKTFPTRLGHPSFYPLPDAAFNDDGTVSDDFGHHPIGNGMYKMQAWESKKQIKLVKNPDYSGSRAVDNEGVTFRFYAKPEAAYQDLKDNKLDVLDSIESSKLNTFDRDLDGRAVSQPAAWIQTIQIPTNADQLGMDTQGMLRRAAISHAIDRKFIVNQVYKDTMTPATDFTAPTLPGYDSDLPGSQVLTFDPEKAKQLWDKADAIEPFDQILTIVYNSDGGDQVWVDMVTQQLHDNLGIKVRAETYPDYATLLDDVQGGHITSAFRMSYQADWPTQTSILENLYKTGAASNFTGYSNTDFDALVNRANVSASPSSAHEDVAAAQQILFHDLPAIPLWYININAGWSTKVRNVSFDWHGMPEYRLITKH